MPDLKRVGQAPLVVACAHKRKSSLALGSIVKPFGGCRGCRPRVRLAATATRHQAALKQAQHGALLTWQARDRGSIRGGCDDRKGTLEVTGDDLGMNVALPANGRGIVEPARDPFDGTAHIGLRLGLVRKWSNVTKRHGRKHSAGPGAKILGGHVRSRDLAEIVVHIGRVDRATNARLTNMLKEMLPGQVLDFPHNAGDAPIFDAQPPGFAAFALKVKAQFRTINVKMRGAKGGQTVGAILLGILTVADTYQGFVEKTDDRGQHLLSRRSAL